MDQIAAIERSDTLAQRAYDSLRAAIRSNALVHNQVYSEAELANSLGISRTPVREALLELSRQGIVEILPQRGFRLRRLTAPERAEVMDIRLALETMVVSRLAEVATEADVAALEGLVAKQREAIDDAVDFLTYDEQFHLLMPGILGLQRTHDMLMALRGAMWLIGSLALSVRERSPHVLEEHQRIVQAIAAHEPEAAAEAMREHLASTREAVEEELAFEAEAEPQV